MPQVCPQVRLQLKRCNQKKSGHLFKKNRPDFFADTGLKRRLPEKLNHVLALCHHAQTKASLINLGFGHVQQYAPFILNLSALYLNHSYTTEVGVPKFAF